MRWVADSAVLVFSEARALVLAYGMSRRGLGLLPGRAEGAHTVQRAPGRTKYPCLHQVTQAMSPVGVPYRFYDLAAGMPFPLCLSSLPQRCPARSTPTNTPGVGWDVTGCPGYTLMHDTLRTVVADKL